MSTRSADGSADAAAVNRLGQLHITIGAFDPDAIVGDGRVTLQREVDMVKSGLLYGHSATLCSIAASLVSSVLDLGHKLAKEDDIKKWMSILDLVGNRLPPPALHVLGQYRNLQAKKHRNTHENIVLRELRKLVQGATEMLRDILTEQADWAGFGELKRAQDAGLLRIETIELVQVNDLKVLSSEIAQLVTKRVTDAVQSQNAYALFDDPVGVIVQMGILRGELKPSDRGVKRSKQIGLAVSLLRNLPNFDLASMDEILDIRRELDRPLERFRHAIMRISGGIASASWDRDFSNDIDDAFQKEIQPLILDLEDEIRSNSYMRALATKFASDPKRFAAYTLPSGLSLLAAGHGWLSPLIAAVAAGVPTALLGATDTWMEVARKREAIEKNQMFFYYETRRRLGRSKAAS